MRAQTFWPALGVTLLAFGLRAYLLDGQSLWYDEGISAAMAPRDLVSITQRAAADIHPPLYYYLLHLWSRAAGTSEYALRFGSAAAGTLLVCLLAVLGRRLFGGPVGLATCWLAATSPLLVYYSQEARMYSLLLLLGSLSVLLALGIVAEGHWQRMAVAYGLVALLSLYTHYLAAGLLLAQVVFFLAHPVGRRRWWAWAGGLVGASVLWVPWALYSMPQVVGRSGPGLEEFVGLGDFLSRTVVVFAFGLSADATLTTRAWATVLVVLVASLGWLGTRRRGSLGLVALWLVVPVLGTYLLWHWRPLYNPLHNPRFVLPAAPAFVLGLALGVCALGQAAQQMGQRLGRLPWGQTTVVAATILLTFFTGRSLAAYYYDPKYARDDYRGLARHIEAQERPGDAVVLNAPGQAEIFGYYYRGASAIYPFPRQRPMDPSATDAALSEVAAEHDRVWLVLWAANESDPEGRVQRSLDRYVPLVWERTFGTVEARLYEWSTGP